MNKTDILSDGIGILHLKNLHFNVLDAHTFNWMQTLRTGEYIQPLPIRGGQNEEMLADRIWAHPFVVARNMTIDRLAVNVTIAGAGGTVIRLGIYNDGTNLYPGTLLLDAGTVAADGVAKVAATISQALTKGLYWFVCVSDGSPNLRTINVTWSPLGQDAATITENGIITGWFKDAVGAGALADPFVAGASQNTISIKQVLPRLLSLD